mgnify:CR=1 FL=1
MTADGRCDGEASCADGCRRAVQRAYRELRDRGQPEKVCLDAAVTVYCWHHPEADATLAGHLVSSWVFEGRPN